MELPKGLITGWAKQQIKKLAAKAGHHAVAGKAAAATTSKLLAAGPTSALPVLAGKTVTSELAIREADKVLNLTRESVAVALRNASKSELALADDFVKTVTDSKWSKDVIKSEMAKRLMNGVLTKKGAAIALGALAGAGILAYATSGDDDTDGLTDTDNDDGDRDRQFISERLTDILPGGRLIDRFTEGVERAALIPIKDVSFMLDPRDPVWLQQMRQYDPITCVTIVGLLATKLKMVMNRLAEESDDFSIPLNFEVVSYLSSESDTLLFGSHWLTEQITGTADSISRAAATTVIKQMKADHEQINVIVAANALQTLMKFASEQGTALGLKADDSELVGRLYPVLTGREQALIYTFSSFSDVVQRLAIDTIMQDDDKSIDDFISPALRLIGYYKAMHSDNPTLIETLIRIVTGKADAY